MNYRKFSLRYAHTLKVISQLSVILLRKLTQTKTALDALVKFLQINNILNPLILYCYASNVIIFSVSMFISTQCLLFSLFLCMLQHICYSMTKSHKRDDLELLYARDTLKFLRLAFYLSASTYLLFIYSYSYFETLCCLILFFAR